MGLMYRGGGPTFLDYSQNYVNIDTLIEIMTNTQKENGIKETFELRDQFKVVGETKTKEKKPKAPSCNPDMCKKKKEIGKDPFAALLLFPEDGDDDEDDFYLCELCSALGRKQKYDPSVCDSCTLCESCYQYDDTCSGCSYSLYRDGTYYRDKVAESDFLNSDDLETFDMITHNETPRKKLQGSWFSVLS